MVVHDQKGLITGMLYMLIGVGALAIGLGYATGTSARMGPGYFPVALGAILALLGLSVVISSVSRSATAERTGLPTIDWLSLFWITLSIVLFAITLRSLGMVIAITLLVLVSTVANTHRNWRHSVLCAVVMILLSVAIFIWGLGIALPVLPTALG